MSHAVEIQHLEKVYAGPPKVTAVKGVDLTVEQGEIFGLLGPNGAGKSTTVGACTTRIRPTGGTVLVAGTDVAKHPSQVKRAVGVVSQYNTLDRSCTVRENLYVHCRYFAMSGKEAKRRADELLEQFRLGEKAKAMPGTLSGGLAQRLQLARAVAHRPVILFLDEPTAGLDPQSRLALWDAIRDLRQGSGVTVVLTTHYMEEADEMCDRIAIIDHGEVLVVDTPEKLKARDASDTIICLQVTRDQDALVGRLRDLPGVHSVEARDGELRIKLAGTPETISSVIAAASEYGLSDTSIAKPSLETVFIDLTGRDLRE
jgi:ABC-2 type transport system ATP-binding protein